MESSDSQLISDQDGYFGLTLLDIEPYGAYLMSNRIENAVDANSRIYFDDASTYYFDSMHAMTIEGHAHSLSSPEFAISSLESYANFAREMDDLRKKSAD